MMRGPRGPKGGAKPQNMKATVSRLMGYVGRYRLRLLLVLLCILGNTIASVTASTFIKTLIDDYITPMIIEASPDFSGLLTQLVYMACIYVTGHGLRFPVQPADGSGGAGRFEKRAGRYVRPYADPAHPLL